MKIEFKETYESLYQESKKRRDKFVYLKVSVSTKCGLIKKLQDFALKFKKADDNKAPKVKYNIDSIDLYDLVPPQQEKGSDYDSSDDDSSC